MKSSQSSCFTKKHVCNGMSTGFLISPLLDRALRALHCEHFRPVQKTFVLSMQHECMQSTQHFDGYKSKW